jgi:hypothetical protein
MRDNICQILHPDFPNSFPYGYRGASVTELAHKMFYNEAMNVYTQLDCAECQYDWPSGQPWSRCSCTQVDYNDTLYVIQSR